MHRASAAVLCCAVLSAPGSDREAGAGVAGEARREGAATAGAASPPPFSLVPSGPSLLPPQEKKGQRARMRCGCRIAGWASASALSPSLLRCASLD
jgi:hypothetical protein